MDLVPDDLITLPNPQGSSIGHTVDRSRDIGAPSMLYGLVASPESSAKRCAVRLIGEMGEDGALAVPELVSLAEDVSAQNVVRDEASYVARRLVDSVSYRAGAESCRPMIEGLLDAFLDSRSELAYQLLLDLGQSAVDVIIDHLHEAQAEPRKILLELLFSSELTGWIWDTRRLQLLLEQGAGCERLAFSVRIAVSLDSEQWKLLQSLADDPSGQVRISFVTSLAKRKPESLAYLFVGSADSRSID